MSSDECTTGNMQAVSYLTNDAITELSESEMTSTDDLTQSGIQASYNAKSERPAKRKNRSPEGSWSTVARKSKKISGEIQDDSPNIYEEENKIEVCITCVEKLPKQFGLAKMLKAEEIQNVINVKYVNAYKVLIQFNREDSAELITQSKAFNENGFKSQKTLEISQSYGVIKNIDLDLSEEEIMKGLSSEASILSVKRLKRRNTVDGRWEPGESVRICFKGSSLPLHAYIYDTRVIVSRYTYPVTQCSRCWRFGHMVKMCPSLKIVCPKCSKNHPNCETTKFHCNNCTRSHMAMAKICPVYIKERKIRELMAEFNCSYKRALTLYVPPSPECLDFSQDPFLPTQQSAPSVVPTPRATALDAFLDNTIEESSITPTYANVARESQVMPKKISKAEKRKNKTKPTKEQEENAFECMSETSENEAGTSRNEDQTRQRKKSSFKEQISWKILLKKIKENLFESQNSSWAEKIQSCVSIVFEALISFIWEYIGDKPGCNLIKQLWITTTQTLL